MTQREDRDPPRVGSDALLAHEKAFIPQSNPCDSPASARCLMDHECVAVSPLFPLRLLMANP
jgi:hypothetical protein